MDVKKSTLTLRLDEGDTFLLEQLKARTGRATSSETIRYLLYEYRNLDTQCQKLRQQLDYMRQQYQELEARHQQVIDAIRFLRAASDGDGTKRTCTNLTKQNRK